MSFIAPIPTRYAGRTYRSRTESRWALFFDAAGIAHSYEAEGFGLGSLAYLPDFWLPGWQMFVEIKGQFPTGEEQDKCARLAMMSRRPVLLAMGEPEERFQIQWFDEGGCDGRLYVIARDVNARAGHWLVSDDDGFAMPVNDGEPDAHHRGPMFSGGLEAAYEAATSARFERGEGRRRAERIVDHPDRFEERAA